MSSINSLECNPDQIYRVIRKAKETHPNIKSSIEIADFFKFDPPKDQLFDLIYDHTCVISSSHIVIRRLNLKPNRDGMQILRRYSSFYASSLGRADDETRQARRLPYYSHLSFAPVRRDGPPALRRAGALRPAFGRQFYEGA